MKIGIIGLGLIGGSLAKALRKNTEHTVWGYDISKSVCLKAKVVGAIDAELDEEKLSKCELIIMALYPRDTVEYVTANQERFKKGCIIMDCCGVKRVVCEPLFTLAEKCGFTFIGAHPMAGIEFSGFDHSQNSLFDKASMIMVPNPDTDISITSAVKALFLEIGFSHVQISTPEEHDKIIACTSQMAHIVSSVYVKSPTATQFKGFSAGSFADMTRVAKLNAAMWTELFQENADYLVEEIDGFMEQMAKYKTALLNNDRDRLMEILEEGNRIKLSFE